MYVLPIEQIFFVTKRRNHPVTIYRYPPPLRSEDIVTSVEVQQLTTGPVARPRVVTSASATLDGGTVAIRTYETLEFFSVTAEGRLLESGPGCIDLWALREAQREGVGFGANGTIVLTSEAAGGVGSSLAFLNCNLRPVQTLRDRPVSLTLAKRTSSTPIGQRVPAAGPELATSVETFTASVSRLITEGQPVGT